MDGEIRNIGITLFSKRRKIKNELITVDVQNGREKKIRKRNGSIFTRHVHFHITVNTTLGILRPVLQK